MRRIVAIVSLTLDGVMQAPGRADEDVRGGFAFGGWANPYRDQVMGQAMGQGMSRGADLLFGRRTYEDFYEVWPKYVASKTLRDPLPWEHSTLLSGDAAETVAQLKQQAGLDLVVLGCGDLLQTLMRHRLVDSYVLLIHPLVLGRGRRLFNEDGADAALRLANSVTTTTGVVIATYDTI